MKERADLVECLDCTFVSAVETGAETCPKCGSEGTLTWYDPEADTTTPATIRVAEIPKTFGEAPVEVR